MFNSFFRPKGIAVVGASTNPHKLGHGVVRNLVEYHYQGPIYPINPTAAEILGRKCYPSVMEAPDPVDLAVVVVPAAITVKIIEQIGQRGIKSAIVASGGFGETGAEGQKLEQELAEMAARYGVRLIGPNCIGTIDTHTPLNTTFIVGMPEPGDIGFISQSGAMCAAVIDWGRGAGVGFSRIISLGNQIDVNETDMLASMANDPFTKVITSYMEGVSDGRRYMEVARETARRKPIIVLKGGRGESGARAVASHTGALAGSNEAYTAAFERSGVLAASNTEELFDWARALAWQPLPLGKRVAVLTNAGGAAILAVDALEDAGLELAELTEKTRDFLRARLPAAGSVNNPVDVLAGSGPGTYAVALDALLSDPTVDAAIVIQAPQDWFLPASLAEVIAEGAAVHNKPVMASIMGLASVDQALEILHQRRIPNFSFPERAASALAAMVARENWLSRPAHGPQDTTGNYDEVRAEKALTVPDYAALLESYGIQQPPTVIATTADQAVRAANDIGYPVALKLHTESMVHKSDFGGIALDLEDDAGVRRSFEEIVQQTQSANPDLEIAGVLVQKMLTGGQELIVGIKKDQQFGPLLLVGSGGVEVELMRDVATAIAPLNRSQAEKLLGRTRAGIRLDGWRSIPPADRQAVIDAMVALSEMAYRHEQIEELEINPLYVMPTGDGAYAVDVRGRLSS